MTGAVADQREDLRALIVNARQSSEQLSADPGDHQPRGRATSTANWSQKLPALVGKLDGTLTKLDSAAGGANAILGENRAAIHSFANDGLSQLGPTLGELRGAGPRPAPHQRPPRRQPGALHARPRCTQGVRTEMKP